jgi:NitT/TauT family transport system ATP-binding protein
MDEAASSLDALAREDLQDLILDLWRENRMTLVLVTHSIEEAVVLGRRILIMDSGGGVSPFTNPVQADGTESGTQAGTAAGTTFRPREHPAYGEACLALRRRLAKVIG